MQAHFLICPLIQRNWCMQWPDCQLRPMCSLFLLDVPSADPRFSGQSFKQFTLVNYDSRDVPDLKTPHITTQGS